MSTLSIGRVPGMSDLEERGIRGYVLSQRCPVWPEGDDVDLVQKVGRRRVGGITHDIYDVVMTSGTRWWVITHNTNLYPQSDFKSMDQAFTYHLGLMRVLNEQFKTQPDELQVEYVSRPWRRLRSAFDAMDDAEEAEDYQAVGMRCREALVTLAREHQGAEWVRMPEEQPKADDAKNWLRIYADSLTTSRPRDYMRALVERTWALANWQTHYTGSTEFDAQLVLDATAHLLNAFTLLRVRYEEGSADRCPECDSYQLMEDGDEGFTMAEGRVGVWHWNVCLSCGWKSEKEWDNWTSERLHRMADYIEGKWSPPKRSMQDLDPGDGND
jgi:hypothetical protein